MNTETFFESGIPERVVNGTPLAVSTGVFERLPLEESLQLMQEAAAFASSFFRPESEEEEGKILRFDVRAGCSLYSSG